MIFNGRRLVQITQLTLSGTHTNKNVPEEWDFGLFFWYIEMLGFQSVQGPCCLDPRWRSALAYSTPDPLVLGQ